MSDVGLLAGLLGTPDRADRLYGVTIGIVTNNQDPDGLGRVKLKFPWLSENDESFWARVLAPMAGKQRGFYFLPEVDDEVLVAFEHGQIEFPYVLGALWNGKDKPPATNDDGKNNLRVIKSRSGHLIRLDDTDGSEKIEIIDKSGKNSVVIDSGQNTITISADADITITSASGKLKLSGQSIELSAKSDVKIEASAGMDLKANAQMKIKGATVDIN
jgi:uncharacterized protein involved in type VI secretion and phage assembly